MPRGSGTRTERRKHVTENLNWANKKEEEEEEEELGRLRSPDGRIESTTYVLSSKNGIRNKAAFSTRAHTDLVEDAHHGTLLVICSPIPKKKKKKKTVERERFRANIRKEGSISHGGTSGLGTCSSKH